MQHVYALSPYSKSLRFINFHQLSDVRSPSASAPSCSIPGENIRTFLLMQLKQLATVAFTAHGTASLRWSGKDLTVTPWPWWSDPMALGVVYHWYTLLVSHPNMSKLGNSLRFKRHIIIMNHDTYMADFMGFPIARLAYQILTNELGTLSQTYPKVLAKWG